MALLSREAEMGLAFGAALDRSGTVAKVTQIIHGIDDANEELKQFLPGDEGEIDIPDVAFGIDGVRYDVVALVVRRAPARRNKNAAPARQVAT